MIAQPDSDKPPEARELPAQWQLDRPRHTVKRGTRLGRATLLLLALTLVVGYQRAVVFGAALNIQAAVHVALLGALCATYALRSHKSAYPAVVATIFVVGATAGLVAGASGQAVAMHAFSFAPFLIAVLLLDLDIRVPPTLSAVTLTVSAAIGVLVANYIHWYRSDLLAAILRESDDIAGVVEWGRVRWSGYVSSLPLVAQLSYLDRFSHNVRRVLVIGISIVAAGVILTFNRTHIVAIAMVASFAALYRWKRIGGRSVIATLLVVAAASQLATVWARVNPNFSNLVNYRIVGLAIGSADISGDVGTRRALYQEYAERLASNHWMGQGLGIPVSTQLGTAYWADVTLVSFAIPFGLLGMWLFVDFVRRLAKRISRRVDDPVVRMALTVVLVVAAAVSLNDDIWSHKNFIIYFTLIVNSVCRPVKDSAMRQQLG